MKLLLLPFFLLFLQFVNAQVDSNSLMGLPTVPLLSDVSSLTGVAKGNLVYVESNNKIYHYDGINWICVIDETRDVEIDNELLFEDASYYYVSVQVNTTDWMVTRYDRTDINTEAAAMGTGTQPTDLATVSGLTYL